MRYLIALLSFCLGLSLQAQIVSGPMLGQVELRDAKIWLEVTPAVKWVKLEYNKLGSSSKKQVEYQGPLGKDFNPIQFHVGGLDFNTTYEYGFIIDGKPAARRGRFTTKDLWQYRKPPPEFSFLAGSCAYVNEPVYDRPGVSYGGDSAIFETMAKENAAFMLWTGDNWYTREVDYHSTWGLWYRPHHDRQLPTLQNFLKAMPHYASWDDHDYGPNNSAAGYVLKEESRRVFMNYWANPSYGENGEGIYTIVGYGDVDIFLCDDRWWRSSDGMKDSINGQPNPEKTMLGKKQLSWLKNALLYSPAVFKVVVIGSQVLNPVSPYDRYSEFDAEYAELMGFISEQRINGVLFFSGDRHHSEVIKVDRPGTYPLYDVTISPLTSGTHQFGDAEKNNPFRVLGIPGKQNYGRISLSGPLGNRKMTVEFIGTKGEKLGEWAVLQSELKTP